MLVTFTNGSSWGQNTNGMSTTACSNTQTHMTDIQIITLHINSCTFPFLNTSREAAIIELNGKCLLNLFMFVYLGDYIYVPFLIILSKIIGPAENALAVAWAIGTDHDKRFEASGELKLVNALCCCWTPQYCLRYLVSRYDRWYMGLRQGEGYPLMGCASFVCFLAIDARRPLEPLTNVGSII